MRILFSIITALLISPSSTGYAQEAVPDQPIYLSRSEQEANTKVEAARLQRPPEVHIVINIPSTTLTLYENGELKMRKKVSVGTGIYPTPSDKMTIRHIEWNPWWIPPPSDWAKDDVKTPPGPGNPLGLVKMPMQKAVLLHGTNSRSSVGRAASHGCMRMYNEDATELAWYLQSNFSDKNDPALREKYRRNRRTTYYVRLNQRIPVDIIYDPVDVVGGELLLFPDYYGKVWGRRFQIIIDALTSHGVAREKIDEDHVRLHARNWPVLETRIPIHRMIHDPESDRILALPAVDNRVRFFH